VQLERRRGLDKVAPNSASRRFAETTDAGHFAQTGPARVLERVVRARLARANFAPAGLSFGDCARAASLPVHYGGRGRVGALLGLERCSGLFRNLCRGILYN
jgi:hypothetical protein